jgi:hypothetical protein
MKLVIFLGLTVALIAGTVAVHPINAAQSTTSEKNNEGMNSSNMMQDMMRMMKMMQQMSRMMESCNEMMEDATEEKEPAK